MVKLNDSHPLTGFLSDHKSHIERLRATGQPEVLTVDGKAQIVVQDAEAYQTMLERMDTIESARIIQGRLEDVRAGKPGVPAHEVLADIRKLLGIKGK